jgi:hypothetical protein
MAICVTYLLFDAFETGFCPTDEELEARLQSNALYNYSARNWGHHARTASMERQLILNFLESEAKISRCRASSSWLYGGPNQSRIQSRDAGLPKGVNRHGHQYAHNT